MERALNDAQVAIKADCSWLLGYYFKEHALQSQTENSKLWLQLQCFSPCVRVRTSLKLCSAMAIFKCKLFRVQLNHKGLQWVKNPYEDEVNQVILLKEGEYLLKRTVEIPQSIVVAGQGN